MNMEANLVGLVAVVVLGFTGAALYGQDLSSPSENWTVTVAPYIWFASLDSTNTVNGLSGHTDLSFNEVLDIAQMSFNARAEARKGPWGLLFDVTYMDLEDELKGTRSPVNYRFDETIRNLASDFAVSYRVYERSFGLELKRKMAIDPYVGVRYGYLKQEVKLNVAIPNVGSQGATLGGSEDWVEPFVGGRILWEISEKVSAGIRGDIGGFGIGSASDLTWNAVVWLGYRMTDRIDLGLGYRILDLDYSRGSGASEFGLDVRADGPLVGVSIRF
jgi:hypothetical protein